MSSYSHFSARDAQSVLHPASNADLVAKDGTKIIDSAQGIVLRDEFGHELIDAVAGLWCVNVGYGRAELANAMHKAASTLSYYHSFSSMSNKPQIELAERLLERAPKSLSKVFYGSGGSDANDTLMKIVCYINNVRGKPEKKKIISRWQGYHGTSLGTAALTGLASFHTAFDLPLENILHTGSPDFFHHGLENETELAFTARRAAELEALIAEQGADSIAAFIAEPILGAGGVVPPPKGYFDAIQPILKKHDILLIADEVVCGFGRLGHWFGSDLYNLKPDMMATAKGITSGYFPFSAAFVSEEIWETIREGSVRYGNFAHGYTYSGHPIGASVALANLEIMEKENLVEKAAKTGAYLHKQLNQRFENAPFVAEVRGHGMLAGVQLVRDKSTKTLFDAGEKIAPAVAAACYERGLIVRPLPSLNTMAFSPPLVCEATDIDAIVDRFEDGVNSVMNEQL